MGGDEPAAGTGTPARAQSRHLEIKGAKSASDRFNYDYTETELAELVPHLTAMERQVELLQVVFNNNYEDQGQRNGRALMKLLRGGRA